MPEVYLCHPSHGWDYDYKALINIPYNYWYKMELRIDKEEIKNNKIEVYASNNENEYKFEYIRLTNGEDFVLHEYLKENGKWKEVSILKSKDEKFYKISILKFIDE